MSVGTTSNGWEVEVFEPGEGSGASRELCPAGAQPGRVVVVLDAGHHDDNDQDGKPIVLRRIVLGFELLKKRSDGTPFYFTQELTYSMATSSNLYKLASVLLGQQQKGAKFNPARFLSLPVMVNVVHNEGRSRRGEDRTYANVGSISPFPDGFTAPAAVRAPLLWGTFEGKPIPDVSFLPPCYGRSVRSIIEASHEYREGKIPVSGSVSAPASAPAATQPLPRGDVLRNERGEEIPF